MVKAFTNDSVYSLDWTTGLTQTAVTHLVWAVQKLNALIYSVTLLKLLPSLF